VAIANNGAEGFSRYRAAGLAGDWFDVVLMDLQMPVMDGLTSTELIRKFEVEVCLLFAISIFLPPSSVACTV
jgi:CheY-like chemotaxis protein